jgi:hypothetical protein
MARQLVIRIFVKSSYSRDTPRAGRGVYSLLQVGPRSALIWCLRVLLGILLKASVIAICGRLLALMLLRNQAGAIKAVRSGGEINRISQ